jgi:3-oxoacyl-[acyl-carrier protein] reductase
VAVVTGGSRGIGRATVRRLAQLGYSVVVNYVHDQETAEAAVDAVLSSGGAAVAVRADVADELDVARLFDAAKEAFGTVHAVVHAVRGHVSEARVTDIALDEVDEMFRTISRAAFIVNRVAARCVEPGGVIVNVCSSCAPAVLPAYGAHAAAAATIDALTHSLALDLSDRRIRVNGVSLDVDKPCAPERVAEVIAFLLSDASDPITGQLIPLVHPVRP